MEVFIKKLFTLFGFITLMVFIACSNSETPTQVTRKFFSAVERDNKRSAEKFMAPQFIRNMENQYFTIDPSVLIVGAPIENIKGSTEWFNSFKKDITSLGKIISITERQLFGTFYITITFENDEIGLEIMKVDDKWKITDISIFSIMNKGGRTQTVISDPSSPYIGKRPEYSFFDSIGNITTRTRDNATVSVEMIIGYDLGDQTVSQELNNHRNDLRDFVRRYFTGKTAEELAPQREQMLTNDIIEMLNTRFLDSKGARIILFNRLDIITE